MMFGGLLAIPVPSWRRPTTVSVFCEVPAAEAAGLRARLSTCESRLGLDRLVGVHFLRLLVLESDHDLRGRPLPARLVLSAVVDGFVENTLSDWVDIAGDALVDIFSRCTAGPTSPGDIVAFLLARRVAPDTYHVGSPDATVLQIREEKLLADELRAFVQGQFPDPGPSVDADEVRRRALTFVRDRPELPQRPRPGRPIVDRAVQVADFAVTGAVVAAGATLAGAGIALVRYLEKTEPDVVIRQDDHAVATLESAEDLDVQNQFTMVATVRDSEARRQLLRATLFLSDAYSKFLSNSGRLVGVETIHYARIHRIDGGRRFLFMSDFDGSWSRYLFDFLTTGSFAVVPNWTNLLGCPKTEFLVEPGPGFSRRFLPFTRARQVRTDVWYSAYPGLTVTDILKHAEIRRGLFSADGPSADRWVRLL
jgi:hypothetical protein